MKHKQKALNNSNLCENCFVYIFFLISLSICYSTSPCLKEPEEGEEVDTTLTWLPIIEEPKVMKHKSSKPTEICIRESKWTEEKLKQLHFDLKAIRLNVQSVDSVSHLMRRKYERSALSATPRRSGVWDSRQKQREKSATFIQKIIRGRAIQCLVKIDHDSSLRIIIMECVKISCGV